MLVISQDRDRFINLDAITAIDIFEPAIEDYGKWRLVAFTDDNGEGYIGLGDFSEERNAVFAMYDIILAGYDKCYARRIMSDAEAELFLKISYDENEPWLDGETPLDYFEDRMITGDTYSRMLRIDKEMCKENNGNR